MTSYLHVPGAKDNNARELQNDLKQEGGIVCRYVP